MSKEELLELLDRLRKVGVDLREVEVKRAEKRLPRRIWETLSAFANSAGGGILIFGVDEGSNFDIIGVEDPAKFQADLASMCDNMEPPLRPVIDTHEIEGRRVVVAEIPEVPLEQKPCFYRPVGLPYGAYIRVADGDRRLTDYEIHLYLSWRQRPRYDREPVVDKTASDLNPDLLQSFLDHLRSRKPDAPYSDWDDERILRTFGVVVTQNGRLVPTLAGYLCFADFPQDEFPGLHLTVVRYPTLRPGEAGPQGERLLDNVKIEGNFVEMVLRGVQAVRRDMQVRTVVRGLFREEVPEYPLEFLREVIVNALAHRDYSPQSRGTPVQVRLFPDRIEVENPGGLFGPVTEDRLGEPGLMATRNETLMRILEDLPAEPGRTLCENRGTGIVTMLEALRQTGLQPPRFEDLRTTFKVTANNAGLLDEKTLDWLNQLRNIPLSDTQRIALVYARRNGRITHSDYRRLHPSMDPASITRELSDLVRKGLLEQHGTRRWTVYTLSSPAESPVSPERFSKREGILRLLAQEGELSTSEIADRLGLKETVVRYWLRRLRQEGMVEPTTDSVKSPRVRYRLVSVDRKETSHQNFSGK